MFETNLQLDNMGKGSSFIHSLHPAVKFLIAIILIALNSIVSNVYYSIALTVICVLLILFAGISIKRILKAYLFILFMVIGLLIMYIILLGLSWEMMLRVWINLTSVGMPIIFLMFTSPILETLYGIEFLLTPLKKIKIPVNAIVLISTIALSFIPIVISEMQRILHSMAVRGRDIRFASYIDKVKIFMTALIPLLISTLKSTETLASAIAVKNYDAWSPKTNILSKKWYMSDTIFLFVIILSFYISYILVK